ncbi:LysR substrate-binding domain-containing protein [Sneathiella sp.]|jgi:DNA-binding transcriptional LysR family regulator|uniref:LysR substrate-binding domain-containing protein n=1 Tax=Sneathiella sp. TaxID=1964365 RepID=UPI0039E5233C
MQNLNDLFYFAQVVDHGSYAAAGRALGVPRSKLSRRIMVLEERLNVRLIQRSTRKLKVTEIGRAYYNHCVAMMVEAEAAQEVIDRSLSGPQGVIRVSAPPALVCFEVGEMVARYMAANPLVTVELQSTSRRVDVIGEGVDVAIRVRFPPAENSDLKVRALGRSKQQIVGSPKLIESIESPIRPLDLSSLPSLDLNQPNQEHVWELDGPDDAHMRLPHTPRLVTDDMSQLLYAAIEGIGVVQLPSMVAEEALRTGALVDVLPSWRPVAGTVQAIFPSRRGLLPSVRAFIDFLVAGYKMKSAETEKV